MLFLSLGLHALVLLYFVGDASAGWGAKKYFFKIGPSCYAYKVKETFFLKIFGEMNFAFKTVCPSKGFFNIFRKSRTQFQLIDEENKTEKQVIIPRKLRKNLLVGLVKHEKGDEDSYKLKASTKKENIEYALLYDETTKRCYIKKEEQKFLLIPQSVADEKFIILEAYTGAKKTYKGSSLAFEEVPGFWTLNKKKTAMEIDEYIIEAQTKAVEELKAHYKKDYAQICQSVGAKVNEGFSKDDYIELVMQMLENSEESPKLLQKEWEAAEKNFKKMDLDGNKQITEDEFVTTLLNA